MEHCKNADHDFKYVYRPDGNFLICVNCGEVKFDDE